MKAAPAAAAMAGAGTGAGAGKRGFGLLGMAERARLFGGEPIVQSVPGQGTTVRLTLHVEEPRGAHDAREQQLKGDHGERRPDPARG